MVVGMAMTCCLWRNQLWLKPCQFIYKQRYHSITVVKMRGDSRAIILEAVFRTMHMSMHSWLLAWRSSSFWTFCGHFTPQLNATEPLFCVWKKGRVRRFSLLTRDSTVDGLFGLHAIFASYLVLFPHGAWRSPTERCKLWYQNDPRARWYFFFLFFAFRFWASFFSVKGRHSISNSCSLCSHFSHTTFRAAHSLYTQSWAHPQPNLSSPLPTTLAPTEATYMAAHRIAIDPLPIHRTKMIPTTTKAPRWERLLSASWLAHGWTPCSSLDTSGSFKKKICGTWPHSGLLVLLVPSWQPAGTMRKPELPPRTKSHHWSEPWCGSSCRTTGSELSTFFYQVLLQEDKMRTSKNADVQKTDIILLLDNAIRIIPFFVKWVRLSAIRKQRLLGCTH